MKKIVLAIIVLVVSVFPGYSQFRFGGELGFYYSNFYGINVLDSITVNSTSSSQGELFFAVFAAKTITRNLEIGGNVSVKPIYPSFVVYNSNANCQFCPVQKVSVVGITNASIELLPQVTIPLLKGLTSRLFLGGQMNFSFVKKDDEIHFDGKHEGVANVINSLRSAVSPVNVALVYGGSLEYKNILAGIRVQVRSPYTRKILVKGVEYDFKNSWKMVMFSLGYTFQVQ